MDTDIDVSLIDLSHYEQALKRKGSLVTQGKVREVKGFLIKAYNPNLEIGMSCKVVNPLSGKQMYGEVVGFEDDSIFVMVFDDVYGIGPGSRVVPAETINYTGIGDDHLGRIFDAIGNPIDGKKPPVPEEIIPLHSPPINPLLRKSIDDYLDVGIKSINGLLTIGKGQRISVIAGSGVGKSVLLGMIAGNTSADIKIICLVGERGREVRDFIEKELGKESMKTSIVVVATSEQSPLLRIRCAFLATAYAEYFREKGKDVLLMMDSATRFAMARREIGLSVGEPPTAKGYPPSVFTLLPRLFERAGNTQSKGSLTAIYTVLATEGDMDDPIVDAVRSIVDGHIILDRAIAARNHFPAIDVLNSKSRVMTSVVSERHKTLAAMLLEVLSVYTDAEDLINIGAYVKGSNPKIDYAITKIKDINSFLRQKSGDKVIFSQSQAILEKMFSDFPENF